MSLPPKPRVRVTEIGEYIRHHSCERRFRLDNDNRRAVIRDPITRVPFAERLFNALDPVLQAAGRKREEEWEDSLRDASLLPLLTTHGTAPDDEPAPGEPPRWHEFVTAVASLPIGESAYAREIAVEADIGGFHLSGRIDFVLVLWHDGAPCLRLVECKASRRDRTYHRIQVVLYRLIVQELLRQCPIVVGGVPLDPAHVECVVARIDDTTEQAQPILDLEPLPLELEEADTLRLIAEDGPLVQILATPLDDLPYRIDTKCDGCVFSVHCLPESARQRRLELIGIEPSAVRALQAAGVATIDDLAELDLADPRADAVQHDHGFTENLARLVVLAGARRSTLPRGASDPDGYEVESIRYSGHGQLPRHEVDNQRLVRVYLNVHYDYTENRLGALAAHITSSERTLRTRFVQVDGRWQPDPGIFESVESGRDADGHRTYDDQPLAPADVVEYVSSEWSGRYEGDTAREQALIETFFRKLVDAIARVAESDSAPVHFYVWSRTEMTRLVEGCARSSSRLLGSLRELLGCREPTEQLLFSCLEEEVDQRFGLGWTGRGLAVAASLTWFGQPYHWRRRVYGSVVNLDDVFTQDIHDFKSSLRLAPDGTWADPDDPSAPRHTFEIRSRFHDTLTAPYWRAIWDTLSALANGRDSRVRAAISRYNQASRPGHFEAYLAARVHALRWIEERVRFKNEEIEKPLVDIAGLRRFDLGVNTTATAAVDFLRMDHHVKVSQWLAEHLAPPAHRVPLGASIPLKEVVSNGRDTLTATIDLSAYPLDRDILESRTSYEEGAFVRVTPCFDDPTHGQTLNQLRFGGKTCILRAIDWDTGHVELTPMFSRGSRYALSSGAAGDAGPLFDFATLDASPTDFVAQRVERRLLTGLGSHVGEWLDPTNPRVPPQTAPDAALLATFARLLETPGLVGGSPLADDQAAACLDGLSTRIQLLLGPPGTGKTMTTAAAILLRILARRSPGDIVLIGAHTHTALNTLLERIDRILDAFRAAARSVGLTLPPIALAKVHSSAPEAPTGGRIQDVDASRGCVTAVKDIQGSVAIIGGTTSALLNMAGKLAESRTLGYHATGFHVPMLVVDEASMMVFPHFLSLATLVEPDAEIMLAGDHRQLSPIVAHDWEREDRPPTVLYQPFASAYDAIHNLLENPRITPASVRRSALSYTFRLPAEIRELIARLYRLDDVDLAGLERSVAASTSAPAGVSAPAAVDAADPPHSSWEGIWQEPTGLYLVLHDERLSKQRNALEAAIIEEALAAAGELPDRSVGLVTPHRAQRSLLKSRLTRFIDPNGPIDAVDTVERFQGGERPTIIVSATASDPSAISARARFLLDLNRSNVAFSRAKQRLIVICSQSLLTHIPPEVEHYDSALLWKSLRAFCSRRLFTTTVSGHTVQVFAPPLAAADA